MYTDMPNHEPGLLLMHSGHRQPIRPSLGSWVTRMALADRERKLAGACGAGSAAGRSSVRNFGRSPFLPGQPIRACLFDTSDMRVDKLLSNLRHPELDRAEQREQLDLLNTLNRVHRDMRGPDAVLDSQIHALELAFHMQREASEAFDVSREPEAMRELYGPTTFGQSCLLARRLVERGVRFVQVYYVGSKEKQPWDSHSNNDERHRKLCADSDLATAALLTDLKQRGLLDDTLVVWGGEFGRTPYSQPTKGNAKPGRDHHNTGFSMLLAGGGVKRGLMYGATDELGMDAVENRVHVHDLHATILHLLGIDHERLTYRYSGRDFRLTDVHGRVVHDVIA